MGKQTSGQASSMTKGMTKTRHGKTSCATWKPKGTNEGRQIDERFARQTPSCLIGDWKSKRTKEQASRAAKERLKGRSVITLHVVSRVRFEVFSSRIGSADWFRSQQHPCRMACVPFCTPCTKQVKNLCIACLVVARC